MNEQIKELWNKVDKQEESTPPSIVITTETDLQEFAELIVKECVKVMEITDITDFRGIELALKIKQRFGVE